MKKIILLFGILLSGLSVNAQEIEADALAKKIENQPLLIDVRTADEYKEGSIIGALNIDIHNDQFRRSFEALPREKEIIVFCQGGERSREAVAKLREMGFKNVTQLVGGYDRWKKQMEINKSK